MQKVLEKSCFEKKPTSSAFWRIQFHLWRPLHAHSPSSMDMASLRGTVASPAPGSASARGSSAQGLASLDLDASVWGARCSLLTLSPAEPRHAFVSSSGLLVIQGQSSALVTSFQIAPSVPGHPPLSASSYFTDSSSVPSVGSSSSSSPPFLPQLSRLCFQDGSQSLCFSCLHPWGPA